MKYVLAWTTRIAGSGPENEEATKRAFQMYQNWTPPSGLEILQWVARLDGEGGFAVVETDDPRHLAGISGKFAPYLIGQVYPVLDIADWAQIVSEGIDWRESVG